MASDCQRPTDDRSPGLSAVVTVGEVPIADPQLGVEEREAVTEVMESGHLVAGDVTTTFEREFADYCGADHAVGTTNGTTALHAALEAVGVRPGNLVITTPFSFVATANAIRFAGGVPVFADVDPETFNLDPESVRERIEELDETPEAIVPVHLYGLPADMSGLRDIADEYDAALVADAAQAHGAEFHGERVGSIADVATFSFYPTKNMTTGEGGMVTTDDPDVADEVRRFINHGRPLDGDSYDHVQLGHNYRLTNLSAAIGRKQLDKLPAFTEARRENARKLDERLADTPLETPVEPTGRKHVYHQYTVTSTERETVREHFADHGVDTAVYYPDPIHELTAYDYMGTSTPVASRLSEQVFSLPVHPGLDDGDIEQIATAVEELEVPYV
ncbi:DegT/DnrJ/EryC1/StrS family aminotransferase [Halorarius litoreus]|uniref:DegT/DnrJ/EryC1/StrS family aminotransferase n=1 Tax=Halorarius litoreus TaxID=2962676 RepID=UPI0033140640